MPQNKGQFAKQLILLGLGIAGVVAGYLAPAAEYSPLVAGLGGFVVFTVVLDMLYGIGE